MSASAAGAFRELRRSADARAEMIAAASSAYSAALADPLAAKDRRTALEFMKGMRDLKSVIYMALEDADGKILAQLGAGASIKGRTPDLRSLGGLELLSAKRGSASMDVIKSGSKIGKLVVLADITDLHAELWSTLRWTAMVGFIAILGGVALAQVTIARITSPIRELATAMAEVGAKQDFSKRVEPAKRRDETGVLGEAFNDMLTNIRKRDDQIAHHVGTLEQTVEDRTRDFRLAKEEAESANAAKSDFLATMSHEIRTPMNGMMVMAEMLASADLSQRHRRYAEIITRSGASLLTIINDILDLSKIEAGKLDLESVPFSPERMVEDVASLFWEKARSKNLELAVRIAPEVPVSIIGDPTRLNQVITNLVNNALKFTEKGGVTIDVASAAGQDGRAKMRIAVTDTGVGIEKHRIGAIFEAFSQADQSTTRKFGGTGLGLTVCKRLVDAMAGEIVVTSEPGKGSTFTVVAEFAVETAAPKQPDVAGMKVAVAVTSPLALRCIVRALRDLGLEPRKIASPFEAKEGEVVLTQSELLTKHGAAKGAFNICLTDIGDNRADALIRNGVAVDLLALPLGRQALWDFAARAAKHEFRGAARLAASHAAAPLETFGNLAILAVDDNAVNREVLREALLSLGVDAHFVTNGVEAVEAAKAKSYDVVFMDGSMPEMDGFTATKLIRKHETQTGAPRAYVVALTAQVRGADAEAWAEAGADRHMTKPFTSARLTEALKAAGPGQNSAPPTLVVEAPSEAETRLLDNEAIATMEAVSARNGRDVVGKVWKLFLSQGPEAVAKLEELALTGDTEGLARQAHFLKSMSLSAGAARLARLCEAIEQDGKSGKVQLAVSRIILVRPLMETTCEAMNSRLAARGSAAPAAKAAS
ncbi:MAG TPA: ATP-binding protein [Hyphomonadaceae bacterium]|nr:ATP-binding protein [Hyphomonadaceae bacterium]